MITGDGDCCAIGTAHWIHAVRYNMKMAVLLLDNNIYGLTKMQTSPTTGKGVTSNTHPQGAALEPLEPLAVTLSITNASFVAQSVDWNPPHLQATLRAAHHHPGLAFVRIIQRCPHFVPQVCEALRQNPSKMLLLEHEDGVPADEAVRRVFHQRLVHDPRDFAAAREVAARRDVLPIGCLYRNPDAERYDRISHQGLDMAAAQRLEVVRGELDRFSI